MLGELILKMKSPCRLRCSKIRVGNVEEGRERTRKVKQRKRRRRRRSKGEKALINKAEGAGGNHACAIGFFVYRMIQYDDSMVTRKVFTSAALCLRINARELNGLGARELKFQPLVRQKQKLKTKLNIF